MDIHHLKIFVSVYKNKSFTKASEKLHISQPTISEHIKNLEKSLNCKLFDRLGRSIMPTAEADVLYPKALQILDDLDQIQEDISAAGTGVKGKLIIGASTIPGAYILPRMAYTFKKKYPDVAFEILIEDSGKITNMVLQHDLFFGIVGAKMTSEKLDYEPLIEDELVLVATPKLLPQKTITLDKLRSIPFLQREIGSGTRQTFENFLKKNTITTNTFNIVATLGSISAVKQAVKENLGASVISRVAVQEELDSSILHEIPIINMKMKRKFYLVLQKKRTLPTQYAAFCKHMKKKY
ncbi:MAG: selenium metabolism-associated LysR family transcriptional regulator [Desulfobulbaceae bacterium]|nr:selenium metabolism-associated LysR family transcriptional regulator [Desulfobulbaceae bacterium]